MRKRLDFIPLCILFISAIILIQSVVVGDSLLVWKHYVALILLSINIALFFWNHKAGVLALGVTLLLGLLGLLSLSPAITTATAYIGKDTVRIPVFYGQPIFLLWLVIHFIVSGRYYVGIVTRKYWDNFFTHTNSEDEKEEA